MAKRIPMEKTRLRDLLKRFGKKPPKIGKPKRNRKK